MNTTNLLSKSIKNNYLKVFIISLVVSTIFFLPFLIIDNGYFLYYGDFNVQQIPFYKHAHDMVTNGNFGWDWQTDLGVSFIGSYSYYLIGSPFFWLTTLFPNDFVPFLMAPLLILKFACAGVTGYAFIKRFTKNNNFAILGALLYSFCGFNIYNIFFNQFHESMIIFPLLLVSLEEAVYNNRRGFFASMVFLSAFFNYFFFFGQVVFCIIYFIVRCFDKSFPITIKKFFILFLESIMGLGLSCFILIPSILTIIDNPRLENSYMGMNMLLYSNEQRYGLILQSLFFPPDIPARPNFFPDSNAKWSSVSAFLPLFSMTGVVVFFKNTKKHWIKRLLTICLIMAFVPILNSSFSAFNSNYYARWYYMPILIMCVATCIALENVNWDYEYGIKFCTVAVFLFSLIGILPTEEDGKIKFFKFPPYPERFWAYIIIAVCSLILVYLLIRLPRLSKEFQRLSILTTCIVVIIYSVVIIGSGKSVTETNYYELIVTEGLNGKDNFDLDTSEFYRVDEYEALDNLPMFWDMPTIQAFHSVVSTSTMDFYNTIGVDRDVASRPDTSYYGVRGLTSVKYLFSRTSETEKPYLPGFKKIDVQNNFEVYENQYFIPMGFTYDYYITEEDLLNYTEQNRDKLMLKAICLSKEDAYENSDILDYLVPLNYPTPNEENYFKNCEERKAVSSYEFKYNSYGFTSKIDLPEEDLVFFSVPYEKGWSATVNGEEVPIIKSNIGFMAVRAPKGDNTIEFKYQTYGLKTGSLISLASLIVLIIYLIVCFYIRKRYNINSLNKSRIIYSKKTSIQKYYDIINYYNNKD